MTCNDREVWITAAVERKNLELKNDTVTIISSLTPRVIVTQRKVQTEITHRCHCQPLENNLELQQLLLAVIQTLSLGRSQFLCSHYECVLLFILQQQLKLH